MATSQHVTTIDQLDETSEGGLLQFRWVCKCSRAGRWTEDCDKAAKGAVGHVQRATARRRSAGYRVAGPNEYPGLRDALRLS